tara:strand:+ start:239 stop:1579 length:1341 start_codon:yes stop_codon:yes gene_type:complete
MSNIAFIENTNYLEDLCCPISHDLMVDPVLISDGHTYEKENIIKWLSTKNNSPLTNEYIKYYSHDPDKFLTKNIIVKKLINRWKEDNLIKKEFYLDNSIIKFKENNKLITCDNIKLNHVDFTFEGSILDGKFSGNGILKKNNGIYDGEFLNNKKHGKGKMIYENGEIYDGEWFGDIINGLGKMTFKSSDVYTGNFVNNKIHGKGRIDYKNGDNYEGMWVDNKKNGNGIMIYDNGNSYNGEWLNDKLDGFGILQEYTSINNRFYSKPNRYEGNFKLNSKNGKGKMKYENNNIYEGDWLNNKKHGQGKYTFANGDIYDGNWLNDTKHGKGKLEHNNGDIYNGEFLNNKKHGKGIMKNKDGSIYNGIFKESDDGIDFEGVFKGKIINNNKLSSTKEEEISNVLNKIIEQNEINNYESQNYIASNLDSDCDSDSDSDSYLSSSIDSIILS